MQGTNPSGDSSREPGVAAGLHEQSHAPDLQDLELATAIRGEPSMDQPTVIGLDLARKVFQGQGIDAASRVVCCRQQRGAWTLSFSRGRSFA